MAVYVPISRDHTHMYEIPRNPVGGKNHLTSIAIVRHALFLLEIGMETCYTNAIQESARYITTAEPLSPFAEATNAFAQRSTFFLERKNT